MIPEKPRFRQRIQLLEREGDVIEPGDVIGERGPRIGERYWEVVDTQEKRVWRHIFVRPMEISEVIVASKAGAPYWVVER